MGPPWLNKDESESMGRIYKWLNKVESESMGRIVPLITSKLSGIVDLNFVTQKSTKPITTVWIFYRVLRINWKVKYMQTDGKIVSLLTMIIAVCFRLFNTF